MAIHPQATELKQALQKYVASLSSMVGPVGTPCPLKVWSREIKAVQDDLRREIPGGMRSCLLHTELVTVGGIFQGVNVRLAFLEDASAETIEVLNCLEGVGSRECWIQYKATDSTGEWM